MANKNLIVCNDDDAMWNGADENITVKATSEKVVRCHDMTFNEKFKPRSTVRWIITNISGNYVVKVIQ